MPASAQHVDKRLIFEFSLLGLDFIAYADAFGIGMTRIFEEGANEAFLTFEEFLSEDECKAAVKGWKLGLESGVKEGAAKMQADLRKLLGLPRYDDIATLDERIDREVGVLRDKVTTLESR